MIVQVQRGETRLINSLKYLHVSMSSINTKCSLAVYPSGTWGWLNRLVNSVHFIHSVLFTSINACSWSIKMCYSLKFVKWFYHILV